MPSLQHSQAEVVRQLLVNQGLGTAPVVPSSGNGAWPIYATNEPQSPDNCLTVFDTEGKDSGSDQTSGERREHLGIQVRVRAQNHTTGYQKARDISEEFDLNVYQNVVVIDASVYEVHCIRRAGDIRSLGHEGGDPAKRELFTINALVTLRVVS